MEKLFVGFTKNVTKDGKIEISSIDCIFRDKNSAVAWIEEDYHRSFEEISVRE